MATATREKKRLRPEYDKRNWAYACTLDCAMDDPAVARMFEIGRASKLLWNELTARLNALPGRAEWVAYDRADAAVRNAKPADRPALKAERDRLLAIAKDAPFPDLNAFFATEAKGGTNYGWLRDEGGRLGMPNGTKWWVWNTFQANARARRWPTFKRGKLTEIHLEQVTETGPGWPVDRLAEKSQMFHFYLPQPERDVESSGWCAKGWFGIFASGAKDAPRRVPIRVTMHRPFPDGAIVKRIALVGKMDVASGRWNWQVVFNLEIPPVNVVYQSTGRVLAIDAGWRQMESGIRVATMWDGHQARHLVMPFDVTNRREAKQDNKPRVDIRNAWAIQSERDLALERLKLGIKAAPKDGWSQKALDAVKGVRLMKREGIERLRWELAQAGIDVSALTAWLEADRLEWQKQRYIEVRWRATQKHIYRNFAVEAAEQCDVVIVEKLNLKDIAEKEGKEKEQRKDAFEKTGEWEERTPEQRILENAQQRRQLASHYQLRQQLKLAMAKRKRELIEVNPANTTRFHHSGEGYAEPSVDLRLWYSNGKLEDQDINAARNLWNTAAAEMREVAVPLASVRRSQAGRYVATLS